MTPTVHVERGDGERREAVLPAKLWHAFSSDAGGVSLDRADEVVGGHRGWNRAHDVYVVANAADDEAHTTELADSLSQSAPQMRFQRRSDERTTSFGCCDDVVANGGVRHGASFEAHVFGDRADSLRVFLHGTPGPRINSSPKGHEASARRMQTRERPRIRRRQPVCPRGEANKWTAEIWARHAETPGEPDIVYSVRLNPVE